MAGILSDNRWKVDDQEFARRILVTDVPGLLSRQLIVEPGSRALLYDDGQDLGEVGPGVYTMESLLSKLSRAWKKKQATAILTRTDDVFVEVRLPRVWSADDRPLEAELRCAFQMRKAGPFLENRMGPRESVGVDEISRDMQRLVEQVLREQAVGMTFAELRAPDARERLTSKLQRELEAVVQRWGLAFSDVHRLSVQLHEFDDLRERSAGEWLRREEVRVAREQMENDAQHAQVDEGKLEQQEAHEFARERIRLAARTRLRDLVLENDLSKLDRNRTLKDALKTYQIEGLLRNDEIEKYEQIIQQGKDDRKRIADHIQSEMKIQNEADLDALRHRRNYEYRRQRFELETELTNLSRSESNRRLTENLDRERRLLDARREEDLRRVEHARKRGLLARPEELDRVAHDLEIERLRRQDAYAKHQDELLRQREQFQLQLEKLRTVRAVRREDDDHEQSLEDRKVDRELRVKADDRRHELDVKAHDLRQREAHALALQGMTPEAMAMYGALGGATEAAQILADVQKSRFDADARKTEAEAAAKARMPDPTAAEHSVDLARQLSQQAQGFTDKLMGLLSDSLRRDAAPAAAPVVVVPGAGVVPTIPAVPPAKACGHCGHTNPGTSRCCAQCGQILG